MNPVVKEGLFEKDKNKFRSNDILQVSHDEKTTEWLCRLQNKPYSSKQKDYVLQNFRLDHQYLASTDFGSSKESRSGNIIVSKSTKEKEIITQGMKNRGISAKTETRLRSILTKSPHLGNESIESAMRILQERMSSSSTKIGVSESNSHILNASAIQNNFQNMLDMTSLKPINELGKGDDSQNDLESSPLNIDEKPETENTKRLHIQAKKLNEKDQCKMKAWKKWKKKKEDEAHFETLLNYTMKLLLKKWEEYLSLSSEEIRKFEIQNSRDLNLADEVIEMLEDKDRYVWQLIEEL